MVPGKEVGARASDPSILSDRTAAQQVRGSLPKSREEDVGPDPGLGLLTPGCLPVSEIL